MERAEIETAADALEGSVIFHLFKEIVGFILYMHQQIPSILQDLTLEFDTLQTEFKNLDLVPQMEVKASSRRKHNGRMREVRQGIRRLEKLVNSISSLQTAFQLMLSEIHDIQGITLVLGSSPVRPLYVYEICFSHGRIVTETVTDFTKSKAAETLSRKAIRALISNGAGSGSYAGPTKLFLLVKAPSNFNLPLHFLPKREFRYSRKAVPYRLHIKCRIQDLDMDASQHNPQTDNSTTLTDSASMDLIWFQCRHTVKGLPSKTPSTEE